MTDVTIITTCVGATQIDGADCSEVFQVVDPTVQYDPGCYPEVVEAEFSVGSTTAIADAGITSSGFGGDMLWSDPATWIGGVVPGDGNGVSIATGDIVHFDLDESAFNVGHNGIVIHGTLCFATASPITGTALIPFTLTPTLALMDSTQITGEGSLFIGNSTADPIAAAPIGMAHRAAILVLGNTPPGGLINVANCSIFGWYDLINETTLVLPQNAGDTTVTVTDTLMINTGDTILIGSSIDQGMFDEANAGIYEVALYDPTTNIVTLTEPLGEPRLVGEILAHVSRPIYVNAPVAVGVPAPLFATEVSTFDSLIGLWLAGGAHLAHNLPDNYEITALTIQGNTVPALYGNSGGIDILNSTAVNATTAPTLGAFLDTMTGSVFMQDCVISGANTGINNITGIQGKDVTIQNMEVACMNQINTSLFNGCMFQGASLGASNGGSNTYVNCTFNNNVVDFINEYEAVCYGLTLGNPLTLGVPLTAASKQWYSNDSYDHNGNIGMHRTWCVGGYMFMQTLETYAGFPTWQFIIQQANLPIYWDTPFLGKLGDTINVSIVMKKEFLGGTAKFQIIDPALDPLYGFGDSALVEVTLPDEIDHWRVLSLTFSPDVTKAYNARVLVQSTDGEGVAYAQLEGLDAVTIIGDNIIAYGPI
jgi:hypothetical protein